jgi:hypothetical protein
MGNSRFLTAALLTVTMALVSGCNHDFTCIATCDGSPFTGYAGGNFEESSADDAVAACIVDLSAAGCTSPRVPECACAD